MQTFDQALLKHVMAGTVAEEDAMKGASSPHDFKLMLQAGGQRASGIEQVMQNGNAEARPEEPIPPPRHPSAAIPELLG